MIFRKRINVQTLTPWNILIRPTFFTLISPDQINQFMTKLRFPNSPIPIKHHWRKLIIHQ